MGKYWHLECWHKARAAGETSIARLPPQMRPRELGRAHGLRQAARVMRAMAEEATRVVGTNKIKDVARQFEEIAAQIEERNR